MLESVTSQQRGFLLPPSKEHTSHDTAVDNVHFTQWNFAKNSKKCPKSESESEIFHILLLKYFCKKLVQNLYTCVKWIFVSLWEAKLFCQFTGTPAVEVPSMPYYASHK